MKLHLMLCFGLLHLVAGGLGDKEGELQGLLERVTALEKDIDRPRPTFPSQEILDRIGTLTKTLDRHIAESGASGAPQLGGGAYPQKFITFDWNSGRMGNQFETMRNIAALCYMTNRTMYLKDVSKKMSNGREFHGNGRYVVRLHFLHLL
jgi:hypothetical protein